MSSNSVFPSCGRELGFYMVFTSDVRISVFHILGYGYFESSRRMTWLLTDSTLFCVACKISLGKRMVWIESNVIRWLTITLFSEWLKKIHCIPPCVSTNDLNKFGCDRPDTQYHLSEWMGTTLVYLWIQSPYGIQVSVFLYNFFCVPNNEQNFEKITPRIFISTSTTL